MYLTYSNKLITIIILDTLILYQNLQDRYVLKESGCEVKDGPIVLKVVHIVIPHCCPEHKGGHVCHIVRLAHYQSLKT